ncbi:MAG: oligosaccharide flippase family protein, partial [Bacteroidota bacterium]
ARTFGLSRSVAESMLFRLSGMVLIFLLQLLLARLMGPRRFGDYTIVITWMNILLVFSLFGFDQAVARFLPEATAVKDYSKARGFMKFSGIWTMLMAVLCGTVMLLYLIDHSKRGREGFSESMFWVLLALPFLVYVYRSASILRAFHRIKASMTPITIVFPIMMAAACAYFYWKHDYLTVDAAVFRQFACTVIIALLISRSTGKRLREKMGGAEASYDAFVWMRTASTFLIGSLIQILLTQTDILLTGWLLDHTRAGYYAIAVRITSLVAFGLTVTDYVFLPKITEVIKQGKKKQAQQLVNDASRQILFMAVPVVLLLVFSGSWLLGGFGDKFETAAYVPMLILLTGQVVNAATGLSAGILNAAGHRMTYFLISGGSALVQMALTYFLLPKFGLVGAAVSSTSIRVILNVLCYRATLHHLGIRSSIW